VLAVTCCVAVAGPTSVVPSRSHDSGPGASADGPRSRPSDRSLPPKTRCTAPHRAAPRRSARTGSPFASCSSSRAQQQRRSALRARATVSFTFSRRRRSQRKMMVSAEIEFRSSIRVPRLASARSAGCGDAESVRHVTRLELVLAQLSFKQGGFAGVIRL